MENPNSAVLYESDFFSWTRQQAAIIRCLQGEGIDKEFIAEELLSLGNSELSALESYYIVLFIHLLKTHYQPEKATRSWMFSIRNAKERIERLLRKNPGMKQFLEETKLEAYGSARLQTAIETGLDDAAFPEAMDDWMKQKLEEK